tara:strand:+ start:71 stop:745 length:675 start_codon:yes stop_codon:yes gene_type:complete
VLFEKIINFFDYFHQNRIIRYLRDFEIKYFIDVGSHKGEFLSYLLKLKYKRIYCFEAQKDIFSILHKQYSKNKKIKLFNIGLADKNSIKQFYVNKISSSSTFSKSKDTFFSKFKRFVLNSDNFYEKKYSIKTKKLDDLLLDKKMKDIFLKVDVEGFELNVLKGAKKLIKKNVKFVLVEKHFFQLYKDYTPNKVDLFLKRNNFRLIKKFTFPLLYFQDNIYIKKD